MPPMFYVRLHLLVALTEGQKGKAWEPSELGELGLKSTFIFFRLLARFTLVNIRC
jgi:hypothetical protein